MQNRNFNKLNDVLTPDATFQNTIPLREALVNAPDAKPFPLTSTLHWIESDNVATALQEMSHPEDQVRKGTVIVYRNVDVVGEKTFRFVYWITLDDNNRPWIYRCDDGRMPSNAWRDISKELSAPRDEPAAANTKQIEN